MILDEFIAKWTGKPVDFDGIYPNQCMDLMHQYVYDVLGLTDKTILAAPIACRVYTNYTNEPGNTLFDKVANTADNIPQKGDIVFFDQNVPGVTGDAGHVCIFVSGDQNNFQSFDANYPTGTLPHIQDHTYVGVLGWLHFKGQPMEPMVCDPKSVRDMLIAKATQRDDVIAYLQLDPITTDSAKITSTIGGYRSRMTDLQNQLTVAQTNEKNAQDQVGRLKTQVLQEQQLRADLNTSLNQAVKKYSDTQSSYEGALAQKQAVIDGLGRDKGAMSQTIASLTQQLQVCKTNAVQSLTLGDAIGLVFAKLGRKR